MKTILVTGVGAIIGYGVIESLRKSSYNVNIIGMDIYDDAVGQHWCNHFEKAVLASSPEYPQFILGLIEKYSIGLIIPAIEQDVSRLMKEFHLFKDLKTKIVLNDPYLLELAEDKWITNQKLIEAGYPAIKSYIDGEFSDLKEKLGLPMLLKPRKSYASKGIQQIHNEEDFLYWKPKLKDNFMVQEIIGDDESEYTLGTFGYGDGTCSNKITFQRKLSGEGATAKAKTVDIPELNNLVDKMCKDFKPIGPTNFQFRKHLGEFLLLEINPRISSSTSIRTAFGYNEAEMCIDFYLENKIPKTSKILNGSAVRYIKDFILYDSNNC